MARNIISVMAGVILGLMIIMGVESAGHSLFPLPQDVEFNDPQMLKQVMHLIPIQALLAVLAAWALGSFGGGWLAARLAPEKPTAHALFVGCVLMLAGIANLFMIPHPLWFTVIGVLLFIPAAWLGSKLVRGKTPDI